jgi:Phage ABA sandwich domain
MTRGQLTATIAQRVMGWTVTPDRFMTGNRGWVPRNRFRPTERIQDAFKLLIAATPAEYDIGGAKGKPFWAKVRIGTVSAEASAPSLPLAICLAIAKALGIEIGACE